MRVSQSAPSIPSSSVSSERTVYSFELGERPGIQLDKVLAIYSAIGLALTVEMVDPAGSGRPRTAAEIAEDFLAHLG